MTEKRNDRISLRVNEPEFKRMQRVVERVQKRNQYMDRSKVLREIIGFDPPQFVTDEDRLILKGEDPDRSGTGGLSKAATGKSS